MLDLSLRRAAAGGGWSASRAMAAQGGEQPVLSRHLPLSPSPPLTVLGPGDLFSLRENLASSPTASVLFSVSHPRGWSESREVG